MVVFFRMLLVGWAPYGTPKTHTQTQTHIYSICRSKKENNRLDLCLQTEIVCVVCRGYIYFLTGLKKNQNKKKM